MLSVPSAGPLPPDPGAKPAGLCRGRLCAAARTPARAASRRRAMPLAPIRRTPSADLRRPTPGGAARCPAALRCPLRHGRRAVFSWWMLVSRRSRGRSAAVRFRPLRPSGSLPSGNNLAVRPPSWRFARRRTSTAPAFGAASWPPRALRRADPRRRRRGRRFRRHGSLPGRPLAGCGFTSVSGARVPLRVAFSPTRSKGVAVWSGLAGILNPCRMEVLQACTLAGLQGLGPRL